MIEFGFKYRETEPGWGVWGTCQSMAGNKSGGLEGLSSEDYMD